LGVRLGDKSREAGHRSSRVAQFLVVRLLAFIMAISIKPPSAQEAEDWQKWAQSIIQIVGGFAVGWFAHFLAVRRDKSGAKATRRREFLASMRAWRHEIDRVHMHPGGGGFEHHPMVFLDGISGFLALAETIKDDFTTPDARNGFEDLVTVVSKCYVHHHDKILKAIDDIIAYTKSAA
jgi:hypothetical protein